MQCGGMAAIARKTLVMMPMVTLHTQCTGSLLVMTVTQPHLEGGCHAKMHMHGRIDVWMFLQMGMPLAAIGMLSESPLFQ